VLGLDNFGSGQVGNGPGYLNNPVMGAHGKIQGLEGLTQDLPGFPGQWAVFLKMS
jgi:hypothetical protein